MLYEVSKNGIQHACFFGHVKIDLARELPDLWNDIYQMSKGNGCIADIEFNVISLYHEHGSKLSVIKITTGKDRHVKNIIKLVFEGTKADPVERYEMIGIDCIVPIWREFSDAAEKRLA